MIKTSGSKLTQVVYFTVKDSRAAKRLTDLLIKSSNDSIILPFIDHPGPLSSEILSRKFGSLTVCEHDTDRRHLFQSHIKKSFPDRKIFIHPDDLFDLSFKPHSDKAQQRCSEIVAENLEVTRPTTSTGNFSSHVKFLVPLLQSRYEVGFLRNLYYQMSLKIGLCSNNLLHYYFLMSDRQYKYLNAKPSENLNHYRSSTILYNTIFNIHKLDSFDLETCFKVSLKKIQTSRKKNSSPDVHVVWLEPRIEIINNLTARSLIEFRFLVTQMMYRRTRLVVPYLENWFEKCSQDIAELGITQSSRSGDLDREQYYKLYMYLKNRPDYRTSTFLNAAECAEFSMIPPISN